MKGAIDSGGSPYEKRFVMPDQSHTQQGQIERAKRLRDHIERLKQGEPDSPKKEKSLKEQIAERTAEEKE